MLNRPRILVIDDDCMFRNLIATLLRKDYFVAVAADGADGFHKALGHPPAAAIVDVQMPEWDGLTTLKAFRSHPALNRTPVMMLTSDASKETVVAAIDAGANDYVIKTSFSKEEFLQKLGRLLHTPVEPPAAQSISKAPHSGARQTASSKTSAAVGPSLSGLDNDPAVQSLIDAWE